MRFALLGDDPDVLPLVRAIAAADEHSLTHAALLGELSAAVLAVVPQIRVNDDWSELLTAKLDGVIASGIGDDIEEAAKRIAAEGTPLIVFPRVEHGDALVYELSLIRDETGVLLFPAVPVPVHDALIGLGMYLSKEDAPKLTHLRLERDVEPERLGGPLLVSEQTIESAFLGDLPMLFHLGGQYSRVTTAYTGRAHQSAATATITLSGPELPDALWTLRCVGGEPGFRIVATTDVPLDYGFRSGKNPCILIPTRELPIPKDLGKPLPEARTDEDIGVVTLVRFEEAAGGDEFRPDWDNLIRAYEMLDAARRSVRRGRTIELHFEETSERSQFKTQMTAIGCGVLLLTMFAVIALLIIGAAFDRRTIVEKKAETAGSIITPAEFMPGSDRLTAAGRSHVEQLAERLPRERFPIVIAASDEDAALDRARHQRIVEILADAGIANARTKVELIELAGPTFAAVMRIARLVVFAPLFLYLAAQLLLFIARPKTA